MGVHRPARISNCELGESFRDRGQPQVKKAEEFGLVTFGREKVMGPYFSLGR